jgi:hypothetical protein
MLRGAPYYPISIVLTAYWFQRTGQLTASRIGCGRRGTVKGFHPAHLFSQVGFVLVNRPVSTSQ